MPAPTVGLTARVELFYTLAGQRIENVFHFRADVTFDALEMLALGAGMFGEWETNMMPLLSADLVLRSARITDLSTLSGPSLFFIPTAPVPGGAGTNALPNNCALVVTQRTAFRGRSFRGRTYIPGIAEEDVAGSVVTDAKAALIRAAQQTSTENAALISPGWTPVVVSLVSGGAYRPAGVITPIVAWEMTDTVVDSQRRRSPRRGS